MSSMKSSFSRLIFLACVLFMLSGCNYTTYKAYTFSIENGDSIRLELDTTNNYSISYTLPFTVSKSGEALSQGTFIFGEAYAQYASVVESEEDAELLDSGTKDGNSYIFWRYNGSDHTEYNYAVLIAESDTGVLLSNVISRESAEECFNRLSITAD